MMSPQSGNAVFWVATTVSSVAVLSLAHLAWVTARWYREGSALVHVQDAYAFAFIGCTTAVGVSLALMLAGEAMRRRGALRLSIVLAVVPAVVTVAALLAQIAISVGVPVADVFR